VYTKESGCLQAVVFFIKLMLGFTKGNGGYQAVFNREPDVGIY